MKFNIKYYKNYPQDMTILEKVEDTKETKEQLLQHLHVIEAVEVVEHIKKAVRKSVKK